MEGSGMLRISTLVLASLVLSGIADPSPAGPLGARHSNSAAVRIGYLDVRTEQDDSGTWAATADLFVNLTTRFGLGLELGMNRFTRGKRTDKYY
jgi:hypothetical protein